MHVAFFGTGAVLGMKMEEYEEIMRSKINAKLEESNRVTLPGK